MYKAANKIHTVQHKDAGVMKIHKDIIYIF